MYLEGDRVVIAEEAVPVRVRATVGGVLGGREGARKGGKEGGCM